MNVAATPYFDSIWRWSQTYGVPVAWVEGVIQTESGWNPQAYRAEPQIHDASYGLMQVLYSTARGLGYTGSPDGLFDPDTNIQLGTKLMGQLIAQYGDDILRVYSAYNSGKPDLYLTSTQVAANVARLLDNLQQFLEPVVAAAVENVSEAALSIPIPNTPDDPLPLVVLAGVVLVAIALI